MKIGIALIAAALGAHPTVKPASYHITQMRCLASNIYYEARGETIENQLKIAAITLGRVRQSSTPVSVCEVVYEKGQFSWTNDFLHLSKPRGKAWKTAVKLAAVSYMLDLRLPEKESCALFYKRSDNLGVSDAGRRFFARLIPIMKFGHHTSYADRKCLQMQASR